MQFWQREEQWKSGIETTHTANKVVGCHQIISSIKQSVKIRLYERALSVKFDST